MIVTAETLYKDFAAFEKLAKAEDLQRVEEAAVKMYGNFYALTISQFVKLTTEPLADVEAEPSVLRVYWLKYIERSIKAFATALENLTLPAMPEDAGIIDQLPKVTMAEAMLIFARSYFGLHSFDEAERITLGEYLIAKKDEFRNGLAQRLREAKMKQKLNTKTK